MTKALKEAPFDPEKVELTLDRQDFAAICTSLVAAGRVDLAERIRSEWLDQKNALLSELKSGAVRIMQCAACGSQRKVMQ